MKIAITLAVVIASVTAAGSSAWAYWSAQANVSSSTQVADLSDACKNVTSVQNASFESPVINQSWTWIANGGVPGWVSTDPVGIEIWQNGFEGVSSPVGNQFVELNANEAGTLSQSISTQPGQILQWSLLHRGRAGVDTMQVLIGSSNSTLVPIRTISDGTSAWGRYSGAYVVPAGQTTTELAFRAISTATGDLTVGNFMDDVSFGTGPCLTAAASVTNLTNPGSSAFHIGDVVKYSTTVSNIGSSLSYKSVLSASIPATVAYKAGSLSIAGNAQSDASGDDQGEYQGNSDGTGTITARVGASATATAGGSVAQGTTTTVTWQATVVGPIGSAAHFSPSVTYVNGLAPLWAVTPAVATDVVFTVTPGVDVGVTAGIPAPATMTAGVTTPTTWTFAVRNNGTATANNVVVHLTAPSGYTSTSGPQISGGNACTTASSTSADCTIGDLGAGVTSTITLAGYAAANTTPGTFAITAAVSSTSGDPVSANNSATGTATVVADTTPPSTVTGLVSPAASDTGSQTVLNWTSATDNAAVTGYNVYRGGTLLATVTGTTFTDTLQNPSTAYTYTVKAKDAAGNLSVAYSNSLTVTTGASPSPTAFYRISYPGTTTYCITTGTTAPASGAKLVLAACDTTQFEKWAFVSTLNSVTAATSSFFVTQQTTGNVLSWDAPTVQAPQQVIDVKTAAGTSQEWKLTPQTNGTYEFVNTSTSRCLAVVGTVVAGLQLQQAPCVQGTQTQQFILTGGELTMTGRARLARLAAAVAIATLGLSGLALGAAASSAVADTTSGTSTDPVVLVSTDGINFAPSLSVGLFDDAGLLVPGDTAASHLWIENPLTTPATVRVNVGDIATSTQPFADNIMVTAVNRFDGGSVTATWSQLAQCDVLVQPFTIQGAAVVKVDLTLQMLNAKGLVAQHQNGSMTANVQMQDASGGGFPASTCDPASGTPGSGNPGSGSPSSGSPSGGSPSTGNPGTTTASLPPGIPILGYTGAQFPTQLLLLGGILIGIGWFLLVARRRRTQREAGQ